MENKDNEIQENPGRGAPGWVRPASYILIGLALLLTIFYDQLSGTAGFSGGILRIAALVCLVLGAALFFSIRDKNTKVDRASAYREVFGRGGDKDDDVPPFRKGD